MQTNDDEIKSTKEDTYKDTVKNKAAFSFLTQLQSRHSKMDGLYIDLELSQYMKKSSFQQQKCWNAIGTENKDIKL